MAIGLVHEILDFLLQRRILNRISGGFSQYFCVGLSSPLVLKWALTLLMRLLPYIYVYHPDHEPAPCAESLPDEQDRGDNYPLG